MDDDMLSMEMTRIFTAPPERVYAAWIDPALIRRWMSGGGYVASEVELDARVGGAYRIVVENSKERHITTGEYRSLDVGRRVVMTWNYEGPQTEFTGSESIVTVTFRAVDGGTEMTLIHSRLANETIKSGYLDGWKGCMDGIAAIFGYLEGEIRPEKAARFQRVLTGPIERVWAYLTESDRLDHWIGAGTIEPRVGGAVSISEGHIRGVVTQWKPPHLLTYTWNVFMPNETESQFPESFVTFELQAHGDDVLLTLTQRPILEGFDGLTLMGWHAILDSLAAVIRGEVPESRETMMERNRERYGVTRERLEEVQAQKKEEA